MTACSTVVISVFYGIFHQSVNEFFKLPVSTIILMLITCFFQPATIFWTQKQRYEIKYKSTFCVSVGTAVMAQVVSVIAVLCLKNSNHNMGVVRLWSAGIVNLIVAIFLYIYICRRGKKYVDTVIAAISNVIMNYVFIMKCGYIAAGYTTLASNLILTALHYINSRKIEKEKVYDFKFCLLSVLV